MRGVEMAVVVSAENGEEEKFANRVWTSARTASAWSAGRTDTTSNTTSRTRAPAATGLRLCAMWLTGFDAPTVSTLYLDKPQKGHTLMQTIARANRVCAYRINGVEKTNGEIVDYYGVFKRLKKAIKEYGQGGEGMDDPPVRDKEELFKRLDAAIEQGRAFCTEHEIDIDQVTGGGDVFKQIAQFKDWADRLLARDDRRKSFAVYANTINALYEASKPEILGQPVVRTVAVFQYLRGVIDSLIERQDVDSVVRQINALLDESVVVDDDAFKQAKEEGNRYRISQKGQMWDLSRIDFDQLKADFRQTPYKHIAITDLRAVLDKKLADMLRQNSTRRGFAERLQAIIDRYNAGSSSVDADFADLLRFAQQLGEEERRHVQLGLTEDELELYDLLRKDRMTQAEEQKVRLAAKALLKRLTETSPKILVQDWFKDVQTRLTVRNEVEAVLDKYLPLESYDKDLFLQKRDTVFELTLDLAINHLKWAA
jgi:type I restriction enzyme, R subunit